MYVKKNIIIVFLVCNIIILLVIIWYFIIKNSSYKKIEYEDLEIVDKNIISNDSGDIIYNKEYIDDIDSNDSKYIDKEITDETDVSYNYSDYNDSGNINDHNEILDNYNNYSENDVIDYFEEQENEVKNSSSFKEKFKEYFIDIVDFIFYNKEIKGYTFDDISNTAKLKIISIALKIDSYIEIKKPNYKENISSVGDRIYSNIKERLTELFLNISGDVCKRNEEECTTAKIIFRDVKDICKIGWDFIKRLIISSSNKLKEWYEVYRG